MTDIAIKVTENKPAIVSFNYQEISDHLDSVLEKYKGLVFTEDTVAGCKKTIAELRKGQKSLDEFRKATKKQLTESVTAFENECKTLHRKFEEVIQPLTEQHDQFELDRRDKKMEEIESIVVTLVDEYCLGEKYSGQLLIPDEYLNKSKTIKSIKAELSALANNLKTQQDKEAQDIDLVKTKVDLANATFQLSNALIPNNYLRLLQYGKSAAEIELLINADAQEDSEREKKAATLAATETDLIPGPVKSIQPAPWVNSAEFITPAPVAATSEKELITAVYEITGTDDQLSALEAFLDNNHYAWVDRDNG